MKVVEMEIRGVGGATAKEILDTGAEQISGDALAGFYRPDPVPAGDRFYVPKRSVVRDRSVEAYEWGRLTSGASTSAMWWVLLPFTLLNVAGWMFRPLKAELGRDSEKRWSSLWLGRLFIVFGGLGLTALYVLWLSVIGVDLIALDCGGVDVAKDHGSQDLCRDRFYLAPLRWFGHHPLWQLGVGVFAVAVVVLLLFRFVLSAQRRLEGFEPDDDRRAKGLEESSGKAKGRLRRNAKLEDEGFWYKWGEHRRLFRWHLGTALGVLGAVAGYGAVRAGRLAASANASLQGWAIVVLVSGFLAVGYGMSQLVRPQRRLTGSSDEATEAGGDQASPDEGDTHWVGKWLGLMGIAVGAGAASAVVALVADVEPANVATTRHSTGSPLGLMPKITAIAAAFFLIAVVLAIILSYRHFRARKALNKPVPDRRYVARRAVQAALIVYLTAVVFGGIDFTPGPEPITAAGFVLLVLVVGALLWRGVRQGEDRGWRFGAPAAAGALSVYVAAAGFSGIIHLAGRFLLGSEMTGDHGYNNVVVEAFVVATVAMALGALVAYMRSRGEFEDDVRTDYDLNRRLTSRETSWVASIAGARKQAELGRRADLAITVLVVFLALAQCGQVVRKNGWRLDFWHWDATTFEPALFDWEPLRWLHNTSALAIVLFVFPGVWLIRKTIRDRGTRKQFAKLWDVIGFWPRRFHALAAPCYAERAVPEFRDRIRSHLDAGKAVVISAHSQGTVIAFAALVQLAKVDQQGLDRVALVTFGSPLGTLYGPFFGRHFGGEHRFEQLRSKLAPLADGSRAWHNFYRPTDYIGRKVFYWGDDDGELMALGSRLDELVDGDKPDSCLLESDKLMFAPRAHSDYEDEKELQDWLDRLVVELTIGAGYD